MKARSIVVITISLLCHLFLLPAVVTSQLLPSSNAAQSNGGEASTPSSSSSSGNEKFTPFTQPPGGPAAKPGEPVTIKARQQEKAGEIYKLKGDVEIDFRNYVLHADEITYDSDSGNVNASGNVRLDGGGYDQHVEASHGTFNIQSETGRFYNVFGTMGMRFRGRGVVLTTTNPFAFTGKMVEEVSRKRIVIHHGTVTSCQLPAPKWTFNAQRIVVDLGNEARIFNSTFRIHGIPTFYFPYAEHPIEKEERHSGFLIPSMGQSSGKGTIVGDSYYWAINRSADMTLGAEYFSKRGFAQHGNFRIRPDSTSSVEMTYFGVVDRGLAPLYVDQGGEDVRLNGEGLFNKDFRGVASIEYLSRYIFRLAFVENFSEAINSEVNSIAFLSRNHDGYSLNAEASKYQNFESTTPGDLITILHTPGFEASTVDRSIGGSRIYWGYDSAVEGLSHRSPLFTSANLVGRFDVRPRISIPLFLRGWTFHPEFAVRDTYYTQGRIPQPGALGTPVNNPLNRRDLETYMELRPPVMEKVLQKTVFGRKIKHTIEPMIVYERVNGIDNFNRIIRFDYRDIVSDTNSVQLSLMNRIYTRRNTKKNCSDPQQPKPAVPPDPEQQPCAAREFLSWQVTGEYFLNPTFGGAVTPGTRNVLAATEELTGIAFLTDARNFSPVISRLRLRTTERADLQWDLDYDTKKGHINGSSIFLDYHLHDFFLSGTHALLQAPGEILASTSLSALAQNSAITQFNQFHVLGGYGSPNRRGISAAMNLGFDVNARNHTIPGTNSRLPFLQYASYQSSYNWDCCGLSFEYRRFALGSVRNENLYRFAFTLANVGSFGNLKRQERLF